MPIKYNLYPLVQDDPADIPLNSKPASLKEACDILQKRMILLRHQGYWRNCAGQAIPLEQVGFTIRPANS